MRTERLYYRDSALRTFRARVASAEPAAGATGSAWNVVLDRTAFYPTSGGQPNDLGTLAGRPVVDVIDRGETVAHVVAEPTVPLSVLERGPGGMCANSGPDAAAPGADLTPCPPFLSGSDAERGSRHPPPRVGPGSGTAGRGERSAPSLPGDPKFAQMGPGARRVPLDPSWVSPARGGATADALVPLDLRPGAEVVGEIDWARRFDHMQQHTGQHILSQCFERVAGPRTVGFHLGADAATIDLDTPRLHPEQAAQAELLANTIVLEDRSVVVHFADVGELDRFPLRKPPVHEGVVRIVEVEGFDWSACGGTHVGRTGSTGPIKIQRWERRGDETRVTFWCGWRALRDYGGKHALVRRLAEGMSVAEADLGTTLDRLLEEQRALRKTVAELRESLLGHEAERLLATAEVVDLSGVAIRLVVHALADRTPDDLKRLAQRLTAGPPAIALLGLGGGKAHLMFAQTPGLPTDLRPLLTAAGALIGGRGGGTRDLAQGGGPQADRIGEALRLARRTLVSEGGGAKGEE